MNTGSGGGAGANDDLGGAALNGGGFLLELLVGAVFTINLRNCVAMLTSKMIYVNDLIEKITKEKKRNLSEDESKRL